jgi:hypothetical protein
VVLVRPLVLAEADVAIDPEDRAVHPGIGVDVGRDAPEPLAHRHHEVSGRSHHRLLEPRLVRIEPGLLIVNGQLPQERHRILREARERALRAHDTPSRLGIMDPLWYLSALRGCCPIGYVPKRHRPTWGRRRHWHPRKEGYP